MEKVAEAFLTKAILGRKAPIKAVGAVKRRKIPYQQQERDAVLERSGDKCEVHKTHRGTDWHHIFNRTIQSLVSDGSFLQVIKSEPWVSSRDLTCLLCHELHMEIEAGRALNIQHQLEMQALIRLCISLKVPSTVVLAFKETLASEKEYREGLLLRNIIRWAVENDKHLPYAHVNET